jgi:RHS repeat-associated protein
MPHPPTNFLYDYHPVNLWELENKGEKIVCGCVSGRIDYTSFGMTIPEKSWTASGTGYRWGFNNMEKDDELKGTGNSYDFGARIYDPRIGRWLAMDPLARVFSAWSPYASFNDNPIIFVDPTGKGGEYSVNHKTKHITVTVKVYLYTDVYDQAHLENMAAMYNDYNANAFGDNVYKTTHSDKDYTVEFKVEFEYMSYEDARKGVAENDQSKNYFYVSLPESGATPFVAGNCGVLLGDTPPQVAFEEAIHTLDPRYSDDGQNASVGSHNMKETNSLMWGGSRGVQSETPILTQRDVTRIFNYSTLHAISRSEQKTIGTGTSGYVFSNKNIEKLYGLLLTQQKGVGIYPNHDKGRGAVSSANSKMKNTIDWDKVVDDENKAKKEQQ